MSNPHPSTRNNQPPRSCAYCTHFSKDFHRFHEAIMKNARCRFDYWESAAARHIHRLRAVEFKMAIDCADYARA